MDAIETLMQISRQMKEREKLMLSRTVRIVPEFGTMDDAVKVKLPEDAKQDRDDYKDDWRQMGVMQGE